MSKANSSIYNVTPRRRNSNVEQTRICVQIQTHTQKIMHKSKYSPCQSTNDTAKTNSTCFMEEFILKIPAYQSSDSLHVSHKTLQHRQIYSMPRHVKWRTRLGILCNHPFVLRKSCSQWMLVHCLVSNRDIFK